MGPGSLCVGTYHKYVKPQLHSEARTLFLTDPLSKTLLCLLGPPGFTCWISFAPVFSFIYC